MTNIIDEINAEQLNRDIPQYAPGDTIIVNVKVKEGNRERLQAFEGVCIAVRNRGLNSAFTVRKISHGTGVERVFQTHSPLIDSIKVKRRGDVRRSKLYYLRGREGKSARIKEKLNKGLLAGPKSRSARRKDNPPPRRVFFLQQFFLPPAVRVCR